MISPCVNRCRIDPINECCTGCNRSLNEIKNWISYSEAKRLEIMQQLKTREIK
jgi:predicted Fe-S protein YdhL (DUF1289 family)